MPQAEPQKVVTVVDVEDPVEALEGILAKNTRSSVRSGDHAGGGEEAQLAGREKVAAFKRLYGGALVASLRSGGALSLEQHPALCDALWTVILDEYAVCAMQDGAPSGRIGFGRCVALLNDRIRSAFEECMKERLDKEHGAGSCEGIGFGPSSGNTSGTGLWVPAEARALMEGGSGRTSYRQIPVQVRSECYAAAVYSVAGRPKRGSFDPGGRARRLWPEATDSEAFARLAGVFGDGER